MCRRAAESAAHPQAGAPVRACRGRLPAPAPSARVPAIAGFRGRAVARVQQHAARDGEPVPTQQGFPVDLGQAHNATRRAGALSDGPSGVQNISEPHDLGLEEDD